MEQAPSPVAVVPLAKPMRKKKKTKPAEPYQRKYDRGQDMAMVTVFPNVAKWEICDIVTSNEGKKHFRNPSTMGTARDDGSAKNRWWYAFASFQLWNRHPAMQAYADGKGVLRYMLEKYYKLIPRQEGGDQAADADETEDEVEEAQRLELEGLTCNDMICALSEAFKWQEGSQKGPIYKMFWVERVTIDGISDSPAGQHYRKNLGQNPPLLEGGVAIELTDPELIVIQQEIDSQQIETAVPFTTASNVWKDCVRSMTKRSGKVKLHCISRTARGLFHDEPMALVQSHEKKVLKKNERMLALDASANARGAATESIHTILDAILDTVVLTETAAGAAAEDAAIAKKGEDTRQQKETQARAATSTNTM